MPSLQSGFSLFQPDPQVPWLLTPPLLSEIPLTKPTFCINLHLLSALRILGRQMPVMETEPQVTGLLFQVATAQVSEPPRPTLPPPLASSRSSGLEGNSASCFTRLPSPHAVTHNQRHSTHNFPSLLSWNTPPQTLYSSLASLGFLPLTKQISDKINLSYQPLNPFFF